MITDVYREFHYIFGVRGAYSRSQVRNDNPPSESYFKIISYSPSHPDCYADIAEAPGKPVTAQVCDALPHHFKS